MKKILILCLVVISINTIGQTLEKFSSEFKYGFKDKKTKKIIIPAKYTSVSEFVDGICAVTESSLGSPNMVSEQKWKIINTQGNFISQDEFDQIIIKKGGFAFVYKLQGTSNYGERINKIGIMKKDGTYIYPCELNTITEVKNTIAGVTNVHYRIFSKENGVGMMNSQGQIIIAPQKMYDLRNYVGCGFFNYTNPDSNRRGLYQNSAIGGLVDSNLKVIINQDSVNFAPYTIINQNDCSNIKNLFGETGGKMSQVGVYRIGYGVIVREIGQNNSVTIKPNIIEIYDPRKTLISKYDWSGKLLYSINK